LLLLQPSSSFVEFKLLLGGLVYEEIAAKGGISGNNHRFEGKTEIVSTRNREIFRIGRADYI
jgi:hypothetical protein